MRLGRCIDLSALSPTIVQAAGATGTWVASSALAGTFTVHLPATPSCGGPAAPGFADRYASCTLTLKGCGSLLVSAAGTGGDDRHAGDAEVNVIKAIDSSTVNWISLNGTNGGLTCHSVSLVPVSGAESPQTIPVTCGDELVLSFDLTLAVSAPACDCTFTVEVLPP